MTHPNLIDTNPNCRIAANNTRKDTLGSLSAEENQAKPILYNVELAVMNHESIIISVFGLPGFYNVLLYNLANIQTPKWIFFVRNNYKHETISFLLSDPNLP